MTSFKQFICLKNSTILNWLRLLSDLHLQDHFYLDDFDLEDHKLLGTLSNGMSLGNSSLFCLLVKFKVSC